MAEAKFIAAESVDTGEFKFASLVVGCLIGLSNDPTQTHGFSGLARVPTAVSSFWDDAPVATASIMKTGKHVSIWFDLLEHANTKYKSGRDAEFNTAEGLKLKDRLPEQFRPAEAVECPVRFIGFEKPLWDPEYDPECVKIGTNGFIWFCGGSGGKFLTQDHIPSYTISAGYYPFVCHYDAVDAKGSFSPFVEIQSLKKQLLELQATVSIQAAIIKQLQAAHNKRAEGEAE